MRILLVDNYDSFTYIICHYLQMCGATEVVVIRNDDEYEGLTQECNALVLSPGPGLPEESGHLMEIIDRYHKSKPILGICLGHQAIAQYFGADLLQLDTVCHGIPDTIEVETSDILYHGLPSNFDVARYHSWTVNEDNLPKELLVSGRDKKGRIMSLRHFSLPIYGVQYHPESIMTSFGLQIVRNWVHYVSQY